jgi:hypothetical protein
MNSQSDNLYLLIVFSPYLTYCESVCFFTNYERAITEKAKLQEKIELYQAKQKEYWKGRVWYPEPLPVYGNPLAEVVTIRYEDLDKVNPKYLDTIKEFNIKTPLNTLPSTGYSCWFDFLKEQKKVFDESVSNDMLQTKRRFPPMYLVVDFCLESDYVNSRIIGLFADPETAYNVQSKVLASYGMDVVFSTYDDKHYVPLYGYTDGTIIDSDEPYYRYC